MTVLLDTSVLIDHLRGHAAARAALARVVDDGERLAASVLTRVEILAGMRPAEDVATRGLFGALTWVPVDVAIAERAGLLANRYLRTHPGVDPVDFVIAATAEAIDAPLWTRNLKHFPMIEDLVAPY